MAKWVDTSGNVRLEGEIVNGGSQPVQAFTVTYAELVAGPHTKLLTTLAEGDALMAITYVITEPFDDSTAANGFDLNDGAGLIDGSGCDLSESGDFGFMYALAGVLPVPASGEFPFVAKAGGLPLVFQMNQLTGDGNTGSITLYLTLFSA